MLTLWKIKALGWWLLILERRPLIRQWWLLYSPWKLCGRKRWSYFGCSNYSFSSGGEEWRWEWPIQARIVASDILNQTTTCKGEKGSGERKEAFPKVLGSLLFLSTSKLSNEQLISSKLTTELGWLTKTNQGGSPPFTLGWLGGARRRRLYNELYLWCLWPTGRGYGSGPCQGGQPAWLGHV